MKTKRILFLFGVIVCIACLTACGSNNASGNNNEGNAENTSDDETNDNNNDAGGDDTVVVATDNSFVPFEFVEDDEVQGFDIDLMKAVADEADIDVEFKPMDFDGIIPGLKSGRWDMGVAGISITDERKESVDFSDPYFESGLIVAVQDDNDDIGGIDDLNGKKVSTRQGSTSQDYLEDEAPDADVKAFEKITEGYQELGSGRVDATLYDAPNLKYYINQNAEGEIKTVGDKLTAESYAIAFQKDSDLVEPVDDALETLKDDGTYDEIYEDWFGEKPDDED